KPQSEWKLRREQLQKEFMAVEGPLDAPERKALWPELAKAFTGEGSHHSEAAVCWLNALWDADPPPGEWLAGWVRSEVKDAGGTVRADDFDKLLGSTTPSVQDARAVVASFLWLAHQHPVPAWLGPRLP